MTVRLVHAITPDLVYDMVVQLDDGDHLVVEGPNAGAEDRDLGYVCFERGDRFLEHYWRTRWYSVKEVRHHHGELKGWYCDVARPAEVSVGAIVSVDLDLDLWVSPDASVVLTLDEDEFIESGLAEADPTAAANSRAALDELRAAAPFRFANLLL